MENDPKDPAKTVRDDGDKSEVKRVNVNFSPETYEALVRLADSQNINLSEALRQSIRLSDYIVSADKEPKTRILIDRGGQVNELKILR
jgi:hypothetical protein